MEFIKYADLVAEAQFEHQDDFTVMTAISDNGIWSERTFRLPGITVTETKTNFDSNTEIEFVDPLLGSKVHHCMSILGSLNGRFHESSDSATINTLMYHNLYVPGSTYSLTISPKIHNVHIDIDKHYYLNLMSGGECIAATFLSRIERSESYICDQTAMAADMTQIVRMMFENPLSGSLQKLWMEAKVQELIALQLTKSFGSACQNKLAIERKREVLLSVKEYLDNSFLKPHTLQQISREFAINEFDLKAGFRRLFNTTVFNYIHQLRMTHARQLLYDTNYQVQEIARIVGYKNSNHFSSAYKKHFGISPTINRN